MAKCVAGEMAKHEAGSRRINNEVNNTPTEEEWIAMSPDELAATLKSMAMPTRVRRASSEKASSLFSALVPSSGCSQKALIWSSKRACE